MQNETAKHHEHTHPERRPAVWPWLLIPLVTLALFFALRKLQENTVERATHRAAAAQHSAESVRPAAD